MRENLTSQKCEASTATLKLPYPESPASSGQGLVVRLGLLSSEANAIARRAVVSSALMSLAAASSNYWRHSLKGPALCVLDANKNVLCRISADTDGDVNRTSADACIILEQDDPPAYRALISSDQSVESFCYAVAQASQWRLISLAQTTPDGYRDIIGRHETELDASMKDWIFSNDIRELTNDLLVDAGLCFRTNAATP